MIKVNKETPMYPNDDSPKARGERLKHLRLLAKLSREELSNLSGCGASTIQYWEAGKSKGLPAHEAEKLTYILNKVGVKCTLSWLMQGLDEMPIMGSTLISGATAEKIDSSIENEVNFFISQHPDAAILNIQDDSMAPFYQIDDWVGGIKCYEVGLLNLINQHCLVEIEKGELVCRVLKLANRKKHYHLLSTNVFSDASPLIYPDTKIISAARVIWHRRPEQGLSRRAK